MYTKDNMLDDFLFKGFVRLNDPLMFTEIDFECLRWKNSGMVGLPIAERDNETNDAISRTQKMLGEKYVKLFDENYKCGDMCEIVNGMDEATLSWHNDLVEGYNLCILLYFDTMDSDIGGDISFRESITKEQTGNFYPNHGDVLIMNHSERFEHVVAPLKMPLHRRVASFNYNINDILTR
jgi:hypothetical protein